MHSIGDIKWNFSRLAEEKYGKALLPTAVRWILDQGVDIAIWEGRRPDQLQAGKGGVRLVDRRKIQEAGRKNRQRDHHRSGGA